METVFISGSIAISRLDQRVKDRISKAVEAGLSVAVGDADGADTSIQQHLDSINAEHVTVYCSGDRPRNNVGDWTVEHVYPDAEPGTRAYFTAKDVKMAEGADYGLMIWDTKSTGTLSNVIELLKAKKTSVVFVNKAKTFMKVKDDQTLELLLENMSDIAKAKAEKKIGLASKIAALKQPQFSL
ncbi:hypothetical protein HHL08_05775 [Sphingobium sp. AR-3-1]|uniref:Uncharacterized protein n=1 Tax=Sphingobium psychrophilum TaxID=2728834 RepID=A0A7X9WUD2_9SPHN|nr:hypothetical protein [Sphingobium psychrophilum]NML09658.1 hypothetical protein [Sphingobium psychrophilum]